MRLRTTATRAAPAVQPNFANLEVKGLFKRFGMMTVLNPVSFAIQNGSYLVHPMRLRDPMK